MQLSHSTRRTTVHLRSALLVGAAVTLAACGDSTLSPSGTRGASLDRPVLDKMVGATTVTYDPNRGVYVNVGDHNVLYIPANGVCDPSTSTYAPGQWDKPCNLLQKPIKITAQSWIDNQGHPYVQFEPALRFNPTKWSVLYIGDAKAQLDLTVRITYCPDHGPCVDESKKDPSLATFHWAGGVYRRIKHFSGYNVAAGFDDSDGRASDSRSVLGGATMARSKRSGYMVVSGLEVPREVIDNIPGDQNSRPNQQ